MTGYNAAARAMIRVANRMCKDQCAYGAWSRPWERKSNPRKDDWKLEWVTVLRKRKCQKCGLYETDTAYGTRRYNDITKRFEWQGMPPKFNDEAT